MIKIIDRLGSLKSYIEWLKSENRIEHLEYLALLNKVNEIIEDTKRSDFNESI